MRKVGRKDTNLNFKGVCLTILLIFSCVLLNIGYQFQGIRSIWNEVEISIHRYLYSPVTMQLKKFDTGLTGNWKQI